MTVAFVGLGANLGDVRRTLNWALECLQTPPNCLVTRCSSFYQSAALDASGPDFINAVAEVQTRLSAPMLLQALLQIEQQAGRTRPYVHAPRTLDLDLLLYGNVSLNLPELVLPHPRMNVRAFVLLPLAEIAPQRVTPQQLAAVKSQRCVRCPAPHN